MKTYTTGQVAKILHRTAQTVINHIEAGKLKAVRVSTGPRTITSFDLLMYITKNNIQYIAGPEMMTQLRKECGGAENMTSMIQDILDNKKFDSNAEAAEYIATAVMNPSTHNLS